MVGCPECGSPSLDRAGTVGLGGTCDSASSRRWEDAGVWRRLRWLAFHSSQAGPLPASLVSSKAPSLCPTLPTFIPSHSLAAASLLLFFHHTHLAAYRPHAPYRYTSLTEVALFNAGGIDHLRTHSAPLKHQLPETLRREYQQTLGGNKTRATRHLRIRHGQATNRS
jgi:hypothetical protein